MDAELFKQIEQAVRREMSAGAFPTHVLAAGDYRVAAQHGDQQYAGAFTVAAGDAKLVEVLMQ